MTSEEREQQIGELEQMVHQIEDLERHPAYRRFRDKANEDIRTLRVIDSNISINGLDEAFKSANRKAILAGYQAVLRIAEDEKAELKARIQSLRKNEEQEPITRRELDLGTLPETSEFYGAN